MNALERINSRITPEQRATMENNMAIANQIQLILDREGKTQKDLAIRLRKSPSEISKWLSGFHNLTTPTISKIEIALGHKVIMTCDEAKQHYGRIVLLTIPAKKPSTVDFSNFNILPIARKKQVPMKVA